MWGQGLLTYSAYSRPLPFSGPGQTLAEEESTDTPGCPEQGWVWGGSPPHGRETAWRPGLGWGWPGAPYARETLEAHISWSLLCPCAWSLRRLVWPRHQGREGPASFQPQAGGLSPVTSTLAGNWNTVYRK